MKVTKFDQRFFDSTRGRVVTLLRSGSKTVLELAAQLGLTDNAVRAHLLTLERDSLVRQDGAQPGRRKPHFVYELTPDAEHLFPKSYDSLLNALITALKGRMNEDSLKQILHDAGRALAGAQSQGGADTFEVRAQKALKGLEALGGSASIERENNKLVFRSRNCPFSAAVSEHPEVCHLAQALVSELVGAPVQEHCDRSKSPKCRFEVKETPHTGFHFL